MEFGFDFGVLIAATLAAGRYLWVSHTNQKAVRWALHAEMAALCELIKRREYIEGLMVCADELRTEQADAITFAVNVPKDYNIVYLTHVAKLGSLKKKEAMAVVRFYQLIDSAIADVAPTGVLGDYNKRPEDFEETALILKDAIEILSTIEPH